MKNKRILITGAAGSIGSETVRQICLQEPKSIVFFDRNEEKVFYLQREVNEKFPNIKIIPRIGSITDKKRADMIFEETQPQIVIHTAAMKHVPLCEENPHECIINNVLGTKNLVEVSVKYNVEQFLFISTDKAVEPISVMGMSKRLCELFIQSVRYRYLTKFSVIRFGNVYGSSGSVVEIFEKQLPTGVLTVTHPEMERYFIRIQDAVSRLLLLTRSENPSGLYILNMGRPIRIVDLANDLIHSTRSKCEIKITGLRPGEKLKEKLMWDDEQYEDIANVIRIRSNKLRYCGDDYRDICLLINDCNNMSKENLLIEIDQIING